MKRGLQLLAVWIFVVFLLSYAFRSQALMTDVELVMSHISLSFDSTSASIDGDEPWFELRLVTPQAEMSIPTGLDNSSFSQGFDDWQRIGVVNLVDQWQDELGPTKTQMVMIGDEFNSGFLEDNCLLRQLQPDQFGPWLQVDYQLISSEDLPGFDQPALEIRLNEQVVFQADADQASGWQSEVLDLSTLTEDEVELKICSGNTGDTQRSSFTLVDQVLASVIKLGVDDSLEIELLADSNPESDLNRLWYFQSGDKVEVEFDSHYSFQISQALDSNLLYLQRSGDAEVHQLSVYFEPQAEPEVETGQVLINEMMYNPEGSDQAAEWVELINMSSSPIELSGWRLIDAALNEVVISRENMLLPGQSAMEPIAGTLLPAEGMALVQILGRPILNNSGDNLLLLDSNSVLVDQVEYEGGSSEGLTVGRLPDGSSNMIDGLLASPLEANQTASGD